MNWQKYTFEGWLEQFGAWCDTAKHSEPHSLHTNIIYELMVQSGYAKNHTYRPKPCDISDDEAMAVQALLSRIVSECDAQMRADVSLLIAHKVSGFSLRKIADKHHTQKDDVKLRIHGAKCYIKGRYAVLNHA